MIWIRVHLLLRLLKAFYVFLFILSSFQPLCLTDTQLYLPFVDVVVVVVVGFSAPGDKLSSCWVLVGQTLCPEPTHSHAHTFKKHQTHSLIALIFKFVRFCFVLFLFCIRQCLHFCLFFSFDVSSTAEWHRQVSWLGQFGWYNCYYQHPTFRRIPGSRTYFSNLMLEWKQTFLTQWVQALAAVQITRCVWYAAVIVCVSWQYKMSHTVDC